MNLLKYTCVIIAPALNTFGILIIVSFSFIFIGWLSFSIYARDAFYSCCVKREEVRTESNEKGSSSAEAGSETTKL